MDLEKRLKGASLPTEANQNRATCVSSVFFYRSSAWALFSYAITYLLEGHIVI